MAVGVAVGGAGVGGGGGVAWFGGGRAGGAPDGAFAVHVVGPVGGLHGGTVAVEDATELRVLLALAAQEGFDVAWDDMPGCAFDYVRGVAGYGESSTGGWNFYVRHGDAREWVWQPRSAACPGLQAGDAVLWCWVEPDERCATYP